MTVSMSNDPWSQFAGGPPPGAPPPPAHLTYVDGDIVGFDVRMTLPDRCLVCGKDGCTERLTMVPTPGGAVRSSLLALLGGERRMGALHTDGYRLRLVLPVCNRCQRLQRRAAWLFWVVWFTPLWIIFFGGGAAAINETVGGFVILGLIPVAIGLAVWTRILRSRYRLVLKRLDGDGVARLRPVHHKAAEAITSAAAGDPVG